MKMFRSVVALLALLLLSAAVDVTPSSAVTLYYALDTSRATLSLDVSLPVSACEETRTFGPNDLAHFWVDTERWNYGFQVTHNGPGELRDPSFVPHPQGAERFAQVFGAPIVLNVQAFGYTDYWYEQIRPNREDEETFKVMPDPRLPLDFLAVTNDPTVLMDEGVWNRNSPLAREIAESAGMEVSHFYPTLGTGARNNNDGASFLVSQNNTFFGHLRAGNVRFVASGFSKPVYVGTTPAPVPEPSTLLLLGIGAAVLAKRSRVRCNETRS